ncbi:MAG: YncE family protein, partial [Verrucomicrobia bacterium]|nr:YncE family protein [Verrucomicrobiota bacterium]
GSIWFTLSRPFLFCAPAVFIGFCLIAQAGAQEDSDNIATNATGVPRNTVIKTIDVGGNPYSIAVSNSCKFVYATDPRNQTIIKISAKTKKVVKKFPVTNPYAVVVTPNGKQLFVTNYLQGFVYELNAKTGKLIDTFTMPANSQPRYLAITPDGSQVWVPNGSSGKVYVIDTADEGGGDFTSKDLRAPLGVAFSADSSTAYVADLNSSGVVVFDVASKSETGLVPLSYGPTWCAVNPATGTAYADRPYNVDSDIPAIFQFTVISSGVQTVTTSQIPSNFAVTSDGKYLYVPFAHASTRETGNTVVMFDTTTLEAVGDPITVGNEPEYVAVARNGKRAYVSNFKDGTISVINTTPEP